MRTSQKGLSLIELVVTLFVVSVLLSIGAPQFSEFVANNRIAASVNEANIALHLARTEAKKRNSFVSICPSPDWDAIDPSCDPNASFDEGWIVFIDADIDGVPNLSIDSGNGDIVLQSHQAINESMDLRAGDANGIIDSPQFIVFAPTGYPIQELNGNNAVFNLQLCDDRGVKETGGGISAGRWINIGPTGRPQMHRTGVALEHENNPLGGCGYMGT